MGRKLGTIPLSADVLNKANIGLWAFELDEGKEPRMYVDEAMLGLIGLDHQISPEKTYHAWYDYIDEGSYGLVAEAVDKMTSGQHAEVQYPWHGPDGRTIIVRCGGVRNYDYKTGIRIEGTHQDVTKVIHFDEKELQRLRQQEQELVKTNIRAEAFAYVSGNNPNAEKFVDFVGNKILNRFGCDQVVFIDVQGRRVEVDAQGIESVPQSLCSQCPFESCRGRKDFGENGSIIMNDCSKGYKGEIIHPDCPLKSTFIKQVFADDKLVGWLNVNYIREYHSFTKSEEEIFDTISSCLGILLERINHKKAEEEMAARELSERALRQDREIIEILASEYSSVYYIDLTTDGLTPYTMNDETETTFGSVFRSGITYSEAYRLYVDKLIYPEDKAMMLRAGSLDNIKHELSKKKTFLTTYRDADNKYSEMKFVKVGGENDEPTAVALGFAEKDELIRQEQTAAQERQMNFDIIEILASEYSSVYYIDLTTDGLTPYTMNDETETTFGSVFRSGITYSEAYRLYVDKLIYPEDKAMMLKAGSIENIKHELLKKKTFLTTYRDADNKYSEMKFVKVGGENDEPTAVALGFAEKDELIRQEQTAAQERQMNFDIIEILASEYSSVYYIDLTTDGLTPYTMNDETETTFGSVFRSGITYSEAYRLYVDRLVYPEDKALMLKNGAIGNIMKELRTKKTFLTTFRNESGHYSEMKFVKVGNEDGTPTAVALGFADKDAEIRAKQEEQRILSRNIDIIEILASEYSSVYYIDMTTDELDPYTMNEQTESQFGDIFRSGIKYSDAFKMYVDKLVYPEDRGKMKKAGSVYNILDELSNKKTFLTQYRNSDGEYCEMKFVKVGEEENPKSVALGFSNKDFEIRSEIERKEKLDRDTAVISSLSDDFGCVIYTDYDEYSETHYRFDPLFEKHIDGWSGINNFKQRLEALTNSIMHPDDRKAFWDATRPDIVKRETDKDGVYYVNFRTLIDDEETYYQAKFVRDDIHPENVIAGFHNVDAETKREMVALEQAKLANKAKTDFLFNMSHDIRTPMNAIIGFTDMAMKHIDDKARVIDSLDKTKRAGELLLSLINDILDMSRIESGNITLNENYGDVYLSFANIESTMQELAKDKNIDLTFNVENIKDRYVCCDFGRCMRVFVNIITNAIKYTNNGGWVKVNCVQTDSKDRCGIYKYTFEDNGIGMSEEFQTRVFDEFTRENTATVSGIQGTGLGLSVCKSFVTAMNGTIECESKQGVGTKFTVLLPMRIQEDKIYTNPLNGDIIDAENTSESEETDFTGRKVLVVEDNELNMEIAQCILEEEGMSVETANDGTVAVELLKEKGPDYYDFILMDIQMPIMDGYEATRQIRKMYPHADIPIIAVSANAFVEDKEASILSGMNDHVAKPINISELKMSMQRHDRVKNRK